MSVHKIKRGQSVPTTENLVDRQIGYDSLNKNLYINNGGSIEKIGGQGTIDEINNNINGLGIDALKTKIGYVEENTNKLLTDLQDLQVAFGGLGSLHEEDFNTLKQIKPELDALKAEVITVKENIAAFERAIERLNTVSSTIVIPTLDTHEKKIKALEEALALLRTEFDEFKSTVETEIEALKQKDIEIENYTVDRASIRIKILEADGLLKIPVSIDGKELVPGTEFVTSHDELKTARDNAQAEVDSDNLTYKEAADVLKTLEEAIANVAIQQAPKHDPIPRSLVTAGESILRRATSVDGKDIYDQHDDGTKNDTNYWITKEERDRVTEALYSVSIYSEEIHSWNKIEQVLNAIIKEVTELAEPKPGLRQNTFMEREALKGFIRTNEILMKDKKVILESDNDGFDINRGDLWITSADMAAYSVAYDTSVSDFEKYNEPSNIESTRQDVEDTMKALGIAVGLAIEQAKEGKLYSFAEPSSYKFPAWDSTQMHGGDPRTELPEANYEFGYDEAQTFFNVAKGAMTRYAAITGEMGKDFDRIDYEIFDSNGYLRECKIGINNADINGPEDPNNENSGTWGYIENGVTRFKWPHPIIGMDPNLGQLVVSGDNGKQIRFVLSLNEEKVGITVPDMRMPNISIKKFSLVEDVSRAIPADWDKDQIDEGNQYQEQEEFIFADQNAVSEWVTNSESFAAIAYGEIDGVIGKDFEKLVLAFNIPGMDPPETPYYNIEDDGNLGHWCYKTETSTRFKYAFPVVYYYEEKYHAIPFGEVQPTLIAFKKDGTIMQSLKLRKYPKVEIQG